MTTTTDNFAQEKIMTTPFIPYSDIIALDRDLHRDLAYHAMLFDFSFAAALNVVPLLAQELPLAAHHYPIVFLQDNGAAMPVALVGIGDNCNRYVNADGSWSRDTYIPAWIRRYPFVTFRAEGKDEIAVGVDNAFSWANKADGEALFDADCKPTERLQASLNYCAEFENAVTATRAFAEAVRDAGLLQDSNLRIERPNAAPHQIDGFAIVREADLAALPDATVLDFNRRGYLGLIHAHLMSHGSTRQLAGVGTNEQAGNN